MSDKKSTVVVKATTAGTGTGAVDNSLGKLAATMYGVNPINGVIDPPYPPRKLTRLAEISSALNQHIEAIVTNVDEFGWNYEPAVKLDDPELKDKVSDILYCEKIIAVGGKKDQIKSIKKPTSQEINDKIDELNWVAKYELNKLKTFFFACNPDGSFMALRARTRKDLESTGNAYWEIIRDKKGKVMRIILAPTVFMRLMPLGTDPVEVSEPIPVSEISWDTVKQNRFFRRFAEVSTDQKAVKVYFKEYGDPRIVSKLSGKIYTSLEEFKADDKKPVNDGPANEIIHFFIYSTETFPYGSPRWMGNLPAVLGSRELDEVNLGYFENKTVPPLALLVSGGRLSKGVVPRIEEFIEQNIKGRKNFHKILILEAEGQKSATGLVSTVPTIKFVPLREAQQQDALFQNYDEANWEKIGSSFRLPRILVGRDRSINRATANASLRFAEEQVFEPIRNSFDELINRKILPDLDITFWRYRSNTPTTRDPELLAAIIEGLSDAGVLTPSEARLLAKDVFNKTLEPITAEWTKQPFKLSIAEVKNLDPVYAVGAMSDNGKAPKKIKDKVAEMDATPPEPTQKPKPTTPAKKSDEWMLPESGSGD